MKKLILTTLTALTFAGAASAATVTTLVSEPSSGYFDQQVTYATNCEFDPTKIAKYEKEVNDAIYFLFGENLDLYIVDYDYDSLSSIIKIRSTVVPTLSMVSICSE